MGRGRPAITAAYSSVSNGYVRTKLPDGTFKKEYYALARGHYSPGLARNHSLDATSFAAVSGVVAGYLRFRGHRDDRAASIGRDGKIKMRTGAGRPDDM